MTNTVNNGIQFVPENTTDPAAGLNLSLLTIDMLLNLSVESIGDTTPPATVLDGARYIVGVSATGLWLGHDNELAMWIDNPGYWQFRDVSFAFNKTTSSFWVLNSTWEEYATTPSSAGEINTASNLGTGSGLYKQKTGVDLQFKSLLAGTNCTLDTTTDPDSVIINVPNQSTTDTTVVTIKEDTTTGYTLILTDAGKCIEMNNAAANTLTIPPSSSVSFATNTTILVRQMGAGNTTIVAGSGVTIRNPHATLKLLKQYATASLHKRGADEWCIDGNMAES